MAVMDDDEDDIRISGFDYPDPRNDVLEDGDSDDVEFPD